MPEALFQILTHLASAIAGGLVVLLFTHKLTVSREQDSGTKKRKREFFDMVAEIKAQIALSDEPNFWVSFFTDSAAPALNAGFDKVSSDLRGAELKRVESGIGDIVALAKIGGAEVYANKDKILETLEKISAT